MKIQFLFNACCVLILMLYSCGEKSQFKIVSSKKSNITFNNEITESDSFNIFVYEYIYNGSGVAIADFNNDNLPDIYFTGNMVNNQLYLNQGDFEFRNVSIKSRAEGEGKWCTGVAIADINLDGLKDIYVCASAHNDSIRRENILYINKGVNEEGIPVFENKALEYGLNDNSHTHNAAFFDYDNDGDLDLYLLINRLGIGSTPNSFQKLHVKAEERKDKLFRNDWDDAKGHPVFTEVSEEAGIVYDGYGLGVNISDLNQDGWKDIYVTNDYLTHDLVYINQKDGTFKNMSKSLLKHTSYSAMGNDVADINNDGKPDIFALDMLPEDNYRRKTMVPPNNYTIYINNEKFDFQYQFLKNTLQMNQGINPQTGLPVFSDISFFAGISQTDWSWTPMIADFDNDGLRDIIITNGFPKDITDRDFVEFHTEYSQYASTKMIMSRIPSVKIKNYAYKNLGGGKFENVTNSWGVKVPSFSNGAAYGDLDNDGDLDYVVNNINDRALVFKNLTIEKNEPAKNWVQISLNGPKDNPAAVGTIIEVFHNQKLSYWDHNLYRGYLSTIDENIHIGLGNSEVIDSIIVYWPGQLISKLYKVKSNQRIKIDIRESNNKGSISKTFEFNPLFSDVSDSLKDIYKHEESDFLDYSVQPLLPHKLSQYGPGMSVGDVNSDGLDDIYIGGSLFNKGVFLLQKEDGFEPADLLPGGDGETKREEELGTLLFDADNDGDLDLYLVNGSYEFTIQNGSYRDKIFRNDNGQFNLIEDGLPDFVISGSCIKAADYDRDGDLDLFVGGRVIPHEYPKPVNSYVLENISTDGNIEFKFANFTEIFENIGLVTDALWTDFNGDDWVDLIVVGEWMPVSFYVNNGGNLIDITEKSGIYDKKGWYNSITSIDVDMDGDMDYIVGNHGTNSLFKASDKHPVTIYGNDYDGDNKFDAVISTYIKDLEGNYKEYPYFGRIDFQKQVRDIKKKFGLHAEFGLATIDDIFSKEQLENSLVLKANYLQSSILKNEGDNKFSLVPLPDVCQWAPVYGMTSHDFNGDGFEDILMVGNDYGMELMNGRIDAFNGLVLLGNGSGSFTPLSIQQSGILIPHDAKALVHMITNGEVWFISSQNDNHLKAYKNSFVNSQSRIVSLFPGDFKIQYKNREGRTIMKEGYYGSSFLSQSSRSIIIPTDAVEVAVTNYKGEKRVIK